MPFLSNIFSSKKNHSAIVINDSFLEASQIIQKGSKMTLAGASHISLEEGIIKNGEIRSKDRFKEALRELFDSAQPKSIKSDHFFVNIPFERIFPFVKIYSKHTKEDYTKKDMEEFIRDNSPYAPEELEIGYCIKKGEKIIYSALAYQKSWLKDVSEVFSDVGIGDLHFTDEPIAQMKLADSDIAENYALLSAQGNNIFLSLFYSGVLYDCYALNISDTDSVTLIAENLSQSCEEFKGYFNEPVQNVYLADFPASFKNKLIKAVGTEELAFSVLEKDSSKLGGLTPSENYSSTLFGLSEKAFDV